MSERGQMDELRCRFVFYRVTSSADWQPLPLIYQLSFLTYTKVVIRNMDNFAYNKNKFAILEECVAQQDSEADIKEAIATLDTVRKEWLSRPGVTGVDVGYKFTDGKRTDQLAIRVHVRRKLPLESLAENAIFPTTLGRFPVDVIEASYSPQGAE